jgi:hypothetical protein|tara:strand:+ start:385 stop:3261 length:2877 start_codon:yes stop_codon:yes gene_type:complete
MATPNNSSSQNPYGLGNYKISIASTEILRKFLLGKNLQSSYMADSNPTTPSFGIQKPGTTNYSYLSDKFVIDQDTVSEGGTKPQTNLFLDNKYGPMGGYRDVQLIDVDKVLPRTGQGYVAPNTVTPQSFVSSNYTPAEILETVNITNGLVNTLNNKILNDSKLTEVSAGHLRRNLGSIQSQYDFDISVDGSSDSNISRTPGDKILEGTDFMSRITNLYYGYSSIPGNYFQTTFVPDINALQLNQINYVGGLAPNITATANAIQNSIFSNGLGIPTSPTNMPIPSDIFLQYAGEEQQSSLFQALKYNIYRPDYSKVPLPSNIEKVVPFYYVGSKESEPGKIQSPLDAVPQDEFGRSTGALVYGPSTLAKELETVNGRATWLFQTFGLMGKTYMDGGGLSAGWTWFGNKSFASLNAPPQMLTTKSSEKPKRKGGLLDETQKLIDSAPLMGGARRKHAGHAIDQTSKIFNDGYKNISKGSGVKFVDEGIFGSLQEREFCRTWTKDNPYYKFNNMVRFKGNQLGKESSVLNDTFNLNIAPNMGINVDTEAKEKNVKKYMFSIENLAWRGSEELLNLPKAEKGPNGGRIMWFPPYDISIGDTNSAQWNSINFLGRPEPVYAYNYTERIGTLGFKIVVDHPSILNAIVQKELAKTPDGVADAALEAFFAGCKNYDVYELAEKYEFLTPDEINQVLNSNETNPTPPNTDPGPDNAVEPTDENSSDPKTFWDTWTETVAEGGGGVTEEFKNTLKNNTTNQEENQAKLKTKILSKLLGEENYFKHLETTDEFLYSSLKRKLQYFHPSFHSTTPEGLNNRLSFLLQCTRPGKTIPTQTEGGLENLDAENTAFGAPPICVLRVGDFYHTKIAIDSVSFSYDPLILDLNPEGIGVQPMIATVSLNFKYIGGQGLKSPISQLQNALSNNYFANTEMYNPNSLVNTGDEPEEFNSYDWITNKATDKINDWFS